MERGISSSRNMICIHSMRIKAGGVAQHSATRRENINWDGGCVVRVNHELAGCGMPFDADGNTQIPLTHTPVTFLSSIVEVFISRE
jgi:hypothetical protein